MGGGVWANLRFDMILFKGWNSNINAVPPVFY